MEFSNPTSPLLPSTSCGGSSLPLKVFESLKVNSSCGNILLMFMLMLHLYLCERLSSLLLLACSLLTTSEDLFGNTIHCNLDVENIELDLFESYCFMANTFTLGPAKEDDGSLHLHHKSIGEGLGREDKRNTSQVTYSNEVPLPILYTDLS